MTTKDKPVSPSELDLKEGIFLVKLARNSVVYYLDNHSIMKVPVETPGKLLRPGAAFVTIETYHGPEHRDLRGCIGYIDPIKPLAEVVIEVAVEAAFNDPRFPPLRREELNRVTFEVSVLSEKILLPEDPRERVKSVVIGRDGLIVEKGFARGLLLPQVPIEYSWDVETFLSETCIKAGLFADCWLDSTINVYRYEARVFREKEPLGPVEERDLAAEYRAKISRS